MEDALIVTSAVRSLDPYLSIKDYDTRLLQVYCSVICWITKTRLRKIIVCDNSCSASAFSELQSLAESYGKSLEILCFKGDSQRIVTCGKGYGEGEIIKYALDNSQLLKGEETFFKITGRVFVENFDEIMSEETRRAQVFNLHTKVYKRVLWRVLAKLPAASWLCDHGFGYIQTIFYKCGIRYYREHLLRCHTEVDGQREHFLENRMFLPLMRNGFSSFTIAPRFVGVCAGTGQLYGDSDYPEQVKKLAESLIARNSLRKESL